MQRGAGESRRSCPPHPVPRDTETAPGGTADAAEPIFPSMGETPQNGLPAFRFETPHQRAALALRALLALAGGLALCWAGAHAALHGSLPGVLLAIVAAAVFGMLALVNWRRARSARPPLVIDERGVSVDDGLGEAWHLAWEHIGEVALRRVRGRRRIVLFISGEQNSFRTLPRVCHGDAPAEWLAGMIETFRERFAAGSH